jgi:hypothetical protein
MAHRRRTPEEVCIEYAIAAEAVRAQTWILRNFPCTEASRHYTHETGEEECLTQHWRTETYQSGDDRPTERPELAAEDMCENCQTRLRAFKDRREARKRLGSVKRSIETIGKRLNVVGPVNG